MSIVYPTGGTPYLTAGETIFTSGQTVSGVTVTSNSQEVLSSGAIGELQTVEGASGDAGGGEILVLNGAQLLQDGDTGHWQNKGKIIVYSGGFISGGDTTSGGITTILSGGTAKGVIAGNAGSVGTVVFSAGAVLQGSAVARSGGTISGADIVSGASVTVQSGGSASYTIVDGGALVVSGGGYTGNTSFTSNGGTVDLGSGYNDARSWTISNNVLFRVLSGAIISGATVLNGGELGVVGTASNVTVSNGGTLDIGSGGKSNNTTVNAGADVYVEPSGTLGTTTISNGGSITVSSGATISGVVTIQNGGSATIWNNAGGTIDLQSDDNAGLTVSGLASGGTLTTVISGWSGTAPGDSDSIDLAGVSAAGASYAYPSNDQVVVTLASGAKITLNIANVKNIGFVLVDDGHGGANGEACFLANSLISTSSGNVAVQDIQVGDKVLTYTNGGIAEQEVVWTGHRHAMVRSGVPDDMAGYPVRVLKNAIADGVPYKDMLITAEHCLFFKDRFVPVRMLVNGVSIFYDKSITSYDYYHIETEQHSVITADGMLTESYLDTGNRSSFRQEDKVVMLRGAVKSWEEDAAAPLGVERSFVEPLFRALEWREDKVSAEQAPAAHELTSDPDLHLVTETGAVVRPMRKTANQYSFMLPPSTQSVRIVSRASRPSDVIGPFVDDRRSMGVAVADVRLLCAKKPFEITSHLQTEKPEGWHATDWTDCAWTNGDAKLPLGDHLAHGKMGILSMTVRAAGPYIVLEKEISSTEVKSA